jgi:RecB family exonuclease
MRDGRAGGDAAARARATGRGPGRLVLGDLSRDLFAALRDEVAAWTRIDALAPGVVLVGSNLLALSLRRRLAQDGAPHVGLRFATFVDLARALAAPRLAGRAPLPPGGRALVAGALAAGGASDYFAPVALRPGFRRRLAKTFGDLDDGGFSPTAGRLAEEWAGRDPKVRDVLRLYAAYRGWLGERFVTTSDLIRIAAEDTDRWGEAFGGDRLAVFGFYDFTEVQRRLLDALSRSVRLAAFAPDPAIQGHAFAAMAVEFLRSLGLATSRAAAGSAGRGPDAASGAGGRRGALEIVSAPGEVEEAREIARAIVRLARDQGIAFREMAVLLRNPEAYAAIVREALDEAGVPSVLAQGPPLAATPTGRAWRLLLALAGGRLERASVIDFLTSAPLADGVAPHAGFSPSLWDLATKRAGIVEGREAWLARLDAFARSDAAAAEVAAAAALRRVASRLFDDLAALPAAASWARFAAACRRLLAAWIAPSADRDDLDALIADLAANDPLVGDVALDGFRVALFDAMDGPTHAVGAFGIDGVTVSDLLRARGIAFRVVFLPGLVERGFPAPPSQDPILLDRDRAALSSTGAGRLADSRSRPREEELLFALATRAASERVVLSYPRFETGTTRERTTSPFVLRAAEAHWGRRFDLSSLAEAPSFRRIALASAGPPDPDDALCDAERRVSAALHAPPPARAALAARLASGESGASRAFARALAAWQARFAGAALNEHTGRLTARTVGRLRAARPLSTLSPSAMETYATCPYRYFLQSVLRLETPDEPERIEEIQASDRGRLVHRVLSRLFEDLLAKGLVPLDAERLDAAIARLGAIAADEFRSVEARGLTGYGLLWDLDKERTLRALDALLAREAEGAGAAPRLTPAMFEAHFGDDGLVRAEITLPSGRTICFRGAIDRIDATPDRRRFVVIDYKTRYVSPSKPNRDEDPVFRGGEALQLPVYLVAARALLDAPAGAWSEARYRTMVLRTGDVSDDPLSGATLAARRSDLETILETIASGIESGLFPVYPKEGKNCERCDYTRVCGPAAAVTRLHARKAGDPRFAPFLAMKAIGIAPPDDEHGT